MSINGDTYLNYLVQLKQAAIQSDATLKNQKGLALCENPEQREVLLQVLPTQISLSETVEKADATVKDHLVKYEAAKLAAQPGLAELFLQKWVDRIEKKLRNKFKEPEKPQASSDAIFNQFFGSGPFGRVDRTVAPLEGVDQKLQKLISKTTWPKFAKLKDFIAEVHKLASDVLVKELLQIKYPDSTTIPEYAFSRLGISNPHDSRDAYLINKYAPLLKTVMLGNMGSELTNETLRLYMKRFTNMTYLDISGAKQVTKLGLQGHDHLRIVKIHNTQLSKEDFPKTRFKSIETVEQDRPLVVFDMRKEVDKLSWEEIKTKIKEADECLLDRNAEYALAQKFEKSPSREGVFALMALNDHIKRKKSSDVSNFIHSIDLHFENSIYDSFIKVWKGTSDWSEEGFGQFLTITLNNARFCLKNDLVLSKITEAFVLMLTQEYKKNGQYGRTEDYFSTFNLNDRRGARALLRNLELCNWDHFNFVRSRICESILYFRRELIKVNEYPSAFMRNTKLETYEFLHELYVMISNRLGDATRNPFLDLVDPIAEDRPYSSIYLTSLNFALAAGFVLKTQDRRGFYEHVMKRFDEYQNKTCHYPLIKIVLGTLAESDIPDHDRESMLRPRLLAYKGIMSEGFDLAYKKYVLKHAIEGKFGGFSNDLVNGLVSIYSQEDLHEEVKAQIIDGLTKLSEGTHVAKDNAKAKLAELSKSVEKKVTVSEKASEAID